MVYNEKLKRVISMLSILIIVLTSFPLEVLAEEYNDNQYVVEENEDISKMYDVNTKVAEYLTSIEDTLKGQSTANITFQTNVDILMGKLTITTLYQGNVLTINEVNINGIKVASGDYSSLYTAIDSVVSDMATDILNEVKRREMDVPQDELLKLIQNIFKESNAMTEKNLKYEIIENKDGKTVIKITASNGSTEVIEITSGMTVGEIEKIIDTAIQKLVSSLNEAIQDITGKEYMADLFGETTIRMEYPAVWGAEGRVLAWAKDGKNEIPLKEFVVEGSKDKNGNTIKIPAYGDPFGKASNGQYRFIGYSPQGYPLTNPFFRNDKEENVKFWARRKFPSPWTDPELATRMKTSKYKVDLIKIDDVDGNPDLNPLIWAGLQEYWKGYINDPSEQNNEWYNYVKFQIPPTETTWGLAYFPSMIGSGFWYATIPIPPTSYLGIDIQTASITPMPETVTGKDVRIRAVYNIEGVRTEEDKKELLHKDYEVILNSSIIPGGQIVEKINFNGLEKVVKEWDIVVPQLPCKLDAKGVPLPWGQQEVPTYEIETYINHPDVTEKELDKDEVDVTKRNNYRKTTLKVRPMCSYTPQPQPQPPSCAPGNATWKYTEPVSVPYELRYSRVLAKRKYCHSTIWRTYYECIQEQETLDNEYTFTGSPEGARNRREIVNVKTGMIAPYNKGASSYTTMSEKGGFADWNDKDYRIGRRIRSGYWIAPFVSIDVETETYSNRLLDLESSDSQYLKAMKDLKRLTVDIERDKEYTSYKQRLKDGTITDGFIYSTPAHQTQLKDEASPLNNKIVLEPVLKYDYYVASANLAYNTGSATHALPITASEIINRNANNKEVNNKAANTGSISIFRAYKDLVSASNSGADKDHPTKHNMVSMKVPSIIAEKGGSHDWRKNDVFMEQLTHPRCTSGRCPQDDIDYHEQYKRQGHSNNYLVPKKGQERLWPLDLGGTNSPTALNMVQINGDLKDGGDDLRNPTTGIGGSEFVVKSYEKGKQPVFATDEKGDKIKINNVYVTKTRSLLVYMPTRHDKKIAEKQGESTHTTGSLSKLNVGGVNSNDDMWTYYKTTGAKATVDEKVNPKDYDYGLPDYLDTQYDPTMQYSALMLGKMVEGIRTSARMRFIHFKELDDNYVLKVNGVTVGNSNCGGAIKTPSMFLNTHLRL